MFDAKNIVPTMIRLVIASLIVGVLLVLLEINPVDIWKWLWTSLKNGIQDVFGISIDGVRLFFTILVTGAVIVLPIWFVGKLLGAGQK